MSGRCCSILLMMGMALFAAGCEHIHDPWVTGDGYFEQERNRSPETRKALDERALNQADR